jgi:hypothetical protein
MDWIGGGLALTATGNYPNVHVSSIATNAVSAAAIATGAIGADEIASGALSLAGTEIGTDAITATSIQANAIGAAEIDADAIGSSEIAIDAIGNAEIQTNAIGSDELVGTAATEIADSTLRSGVSKYRVGGNYTTAAWKDSVIAAAFAVAGGGAGYKPKIVVDLDSAAGTLADAQIDEITVDIKAADTVTVVNNVLNIASTDTLAVVNNVLNIPSTDTVAWALNVANIPSTDTLTTILGKVTLVDSSANGIALASNEHALDSTRLKEIIDSLDTQGWAATGEAGSGAVSCSLLCLSGSNAIPNVRVSIRNTSNAQLYQANSNVNGYALFSLDASTTYRALAHVFGYTHDSLPYQTLVTTAAVNKRDTLPMTAWVITSPTAPNVKRVYDYMYSFVADSIQGAMVVAELVLPDSTVVPYDTSSGFSLGKNPAPVTTYTNVNGYWSLDLVPNDYIRPAGTRYRISLYSNGRAIYSVTITANGTTTALIRTLQ